MRYLPREVDPLVYNMSMEDPGDINYSSIGGLSEQIRELREVTRSNSCLRVKKHPKNFQVDHTIQLKISFDKTQC